MHIYLKNEYFCCIRCYFRFISNKSYKKNGSRTQDCFNQETTFNHILFKNNNFIFYILADIFTSFFPTKIAGNKNPKPEPRELAKHSKVTTKNLSLKWNHFCAIT